MISLQKGCHYESRHVVVKFWQCAPPKSGRKWCWVALAGVGPNLISILLLNSNTTTRMSNQGWFWANISRLILSQSYFFVLSNVPKACSSIGQAAMNIWQIPSSKEAQPRIILEVNCLNEIIAPHCPKKWFSVSPWCPKSQ